MHALITQVNDAFFEATSLVRGTDLYTLQDLLDEGKVRLEAPMRVALVGDICTSKSTLINAILGSEVVRAGDLEETYNVSWLKHGNSASDVHVYLKTAGIPPVMVPRKEWSDWANRQGRKSLSRDVGYIEVHDDNPQLKYFQLIDTPGLNSASNIDSQNTLDFLRSHPPDAIVFCFTKSIRRKILDLIRLFQNQATEDITPINALGVLAKIDEYWDEQNVPLTEGQKIAGRLLTEEPLVRSTLFRIYPVCAQLALGATLLDEIDLSDLAELAMVPEQLLQEATKSIRTFLSPTLNGIQVSQTRRKALCDKLTVYGLMAAISWLQKQTESSTQKLAEHLLEISGFDFFIQQLRQHFGNRAFLIKLSGIATMIRMRAKSLSTTHKDWNIALEVDRIFANLTSNQAFQELDLIRSHYNGELRLETDDFDELLCVTGENGASYRERLGLGRGVSLSQMSTKAVERQQYWQTCFATALSPNNKTIARVLKTSYQKIHQHLKEVHQRLTSAHQELYGNEE